jgi:hypothetical protein
MKTKIAKTLLLSALLFGAGITKAQWNTFGTGPVYILEPPTTPNNIYGVQGNNTVNNNYALRIYGGPPTSPGPYGWVDIGPQNTGYCHFNTDRNTFYFGKQLTVNGAIGSYNTNDLVFQTGMSSNPGITRMEITNWGPYAGYVGIGITTPTEPLHIYNADSYGCSALFQNPNSSGHNNLYIVEGSGSYDYNNLTQNNDNGIFWSDNAGNNTSSGFVIAPHHNNTAAVGIRITSAGWVGINLTNPGYALDVAGTIRATEVKVCLNQTCDFVFDDHYKLMSLDTLNSYLKCNHHLPGIASAQEMEAEGTVSLAKMDAQFLQKIEELTLYTLQQEKEINELKRDLAELKANQKVK